MIRLSCWVLSIGATGTALYLSVLAGWQRGGSMAERLVWVAISVVLVICAHLLPALVRESPYRVRAVASVLWLACMATACFGHLTFFLLAQRHAGDLRAAAVPVTEPASAGRSLTVVMAERATVTAQLAAANARRCPRECATLEARRVTLTTKLDALDAEASEIRRRQTADDLVEARRDALVTDPVTVRLAALLGTTETRIDLLTGLVFAAVLESVACLLWTITLRPRPAAPATTSVPEPVTVSHPPVAESHEPDGNPVAPSNPDLTRLVQDVEAGRVRVTVADIRRYLGCSQARAIALRRQLAALTSAA
ncbi:hypothetical protein [Ralstonia pickettii]|uniref:hypothetical protein n=1 Tax=Ralstonia pickettii TaxID=329 RepID=UPI0015B9C494|nr:hypothetical protein [Ralstonia pickettii]NWK43335.1 hypothetical protein [Ralstonia pickettii]